jgi:hypothetical protein
MANNFFIPFDNRPASTQQGSGTYTVPSGKFARLKISLDVTAYFDEADWTTVVSGGDVYDYKPGRESEKFELWLNSGDVVTFSNTAASDSNLNNTGSPQIASLAGESSCTVSVNTGGGASIVASVRCRGEIFINQKNTTTANIGGTAVSYWHAEEYNEIS